MARTALTNSTIPWPAPGIGRGVRTVRTPVTARHPYANDNSELNLMTSSKLPRKPFKAPEAYPGANDPGANDPANQSNEPGEVPANPSGPENPTLEALSQRITAQAHEAARQDWRDHYENLFKLLRQAGRADSGNNLVGHIKMCACYVADSVAVTQHVQVEIATTELVRALEEKFLATRTAYYGRELIERILVHADIK